MSVLLAAPYKYVGTFFLVPGVFILSCRIVCVSYLSGWFCVFYISNFFITFFTEGLMNLSPGDH